MHENEENREPAVRKVEENGAKEKPKMGYQPNYGNQFNIGHLTVNVEAPATVQASPFSPDSPDRQPLTILMPEQVDGREEKSFEKSLVDFFKRVANPPAARISSRSKISSRDQTLRYKSSPMLIKLATN